MVQRTQGTVVHVLFGSFLALCKEDERIGRDEKVRDSCLEREERSKKREWQKKRCICCLTRKEHQRSKQASVGEEVHAVGFL